MRHAILEEMVILDEGQVKDLSEKAGQGDQDAALTLIRSQGAWILKLVTRAGVPEGIEIDDLLSDITVTLLEDIGSYDPDKSSLTTFIELIVSRRLPRIIEANRPCSYSSESVDSERALQVVDDSAPVELSLEDREAIDLARDMIDTKLTKSEREIILQYLEDWPLETIASRANKAGGSGSNASSISRTIQAIFSKLRDEMVARGVLSTDGQLRLPLL